MWGNKRQLSVIESIDRELARLSNELNSFSFSSEIADKMAPLYLEIIKSKQQLYDLLRKISDKDDTNMEKL